MPDAGILAQASQRNPQEERFMTKPFSLFVVLLAGTVSPSLFAYGCSNGNFNGTYGLLARGAVTILGIRSPDPSRAPAEW
jgi:hypothetical protein